MQHGSKAPTLRRLALVPVPSVLLTTLFVACILWNSPATSEGPRSSIVSVSNMCRNLTGMSNRSNLTGTPDSIGPESEEDLSRKKNDIMEDLRTFSTRSRNGNIRSSSKRPLFIEEDKPSDACSGKRIHIYQLPSKFNVDILKLCDTFLPWFSMCHYFQNLGMGLLVNSSSSSVLNPPGRWFQTNQYALDVLFHQKLLRYPCLTDSPEQAAMYYVPYYAGLDVLRYHYADVTVEKKNELVVQLLEWLKQQESWNRNQGRDHVMVLGKITWDFRRDNITMWGNTLLRMPDYRNLMKLLIERDPFEPNEIGVPHPTYFHPSSDSDISSWISRVSASERRHLLSFAGMPRDPGHIRTVLIDHCNGSQACEFLPCVAQICHNPEPTMKLFMTSHFCMQPPGDSATRRSVFDSLIAGCIPILFVKDTAYFQYPWHLPADPSSYSVYVPSDEVKSGRVNVTDVVAQIPEEQRLMMRRKIIYEVVPGLLYSQPGSQLAQYEDAFDISIRSLLEKAAARAAS